MHSDIVNIGHRYKADVQAVPPASAAAGTRNGNTINVSGYGSGTIVANVGAASGTPTATTITYALQTSATADGSSGWVALKDIDNNAVVLTATAGGVAAEKDFNLQYATPGHSFIRTVETVAFTGGTAPAVVTGATFVLGGGRRLPL
ncbi:hypothetical protein JGU66_18725 [Myxococcaceae bacterium JPH2]|nr:hypothetical protein [Myxococcaceae bacterium JPH2]